MEKRMSKIANLPIGLRFATRYSIAPNPVILTSEAVQLDFRVAGVDGHTSVAWVGEPPVRKIWGLVALDPSHPILILSRNAALAVNNGSQKLCKLLSCSGELVGLRSRPTVAALRDLTRKEWQVGHYAWRPRHFVALASSPTIIDGNCVLRPDLTQ